MASKTSNMNTATSAAAPAAYKNLLEAHTAFVLDRYAFLDRIQKAVIAEETPESQELFALLKEGNFVELIAGLMADPDVVNREQALYTLANLLALENQEALVARVKKAVLERLQTVFHMLYTPENKILQKTCAYVINNLATMFANRGWKDLDKDEDGEVREFCGRVLDTYNGLYGRALVNNMESKVGRTDLLYAVSKVSSVRPYGPRLSRVLADMLGASVVDTAALLDILNNRLAETEAPDGFIPVDYHGEVLDRFLLILSNDKMCRRVQAEGLWGLSNFVVETGVADKLAAYDELLDVIVEKAIMMSGAVRTNAIWVLANMVAKAETEEARRSISEDSGIWTALVEAIADNCLDGKDAKVASEAIAKLTAWQTEFAPEEESESDEDDETILDEIEKAFEEEAAKAAVMPCERDDNFPPMPNVEHAVAEERVPTALDLILAGSVKPTNTVRALIRRLQEVGYTQWVPVPADTTLTVEDLTTLQLMGYALVRGYMGVNPVLMNNI